MPATKQIFQKRAYSHVTLRASLVLCLSFCLSLAFILLTIYSAHAVGLSFGFKEGVGVTEGMIVSISPSDTDSLEPAHVNNAEYVVGVSVDQASSSVVFDNNDSVYVANEGSVEVFVSTVGGNIAVGDLIVVSTIGGVGQKKSTANVSQKIVGVAKSEFNSDSETAEQFDLEHAGGVSIGVVTMEILEDLSGLQPNNASTVEEFASKVAGKSVSFGQALLSAGIAILGFIVSGSLMFGAVRGSFLSIGRNPLSAKVIYGGMVRASLISLSVMMLGIIAGYVVLIA